MERTVALICLHANREAAMTDGFKAARDFLLAHRTDYATAHREFRWPKLDLSLIHI